MTIEVGPFDLDGRGLVDPPSLPNFEGGQTQYLWDSGSPGEINPVAPERAARSEIMNPFGFHGLPADPETGFIYMRNRYYDPELGRFISTDPLGYSSRPSLYQFAANSPFNYSDRLGLLWTRTEQDINNIEGSMDLRHLEGLNNPYFIDSLQILGGCSEAVVGGAAVSTGFGALALAHGTDLCLTGFITLIAGEAQETLFLQAASAGFEAIGVDAYYAGWAASGLDLVIDFGATVSLARTTGSGRLGLLKGAGRTSEFAGGELGGMPVSRLMARAGLGGRLGGRVLTGAQRMRLSKWLADMNVRVWFNADRYLDTNYNRARAMFSVSYDDFGRTGALYVRANPTYYEVIHELGHVSDWRRIGGPNFILQGPEVAEVKIL